MLRITFLSILLMVTFVAASLGQDTTAPVIAGPDSLDSISEGSGTKTRTGDYTATDDSAVIWSVSGPGFTISQAGRLTFTVTDPNYEAMNTYNGSVTATDIHNNSASKAVTVMILNVDEPGTLTLSPDTEDTPLITAALNDPDNASPDDIRWSWSGYSASSAPTGSTYQTEAADAGKTLIVTVNYNDGVGGADHATARITVGVSPGPRFANPTATVTIPENSAMPYSVGTYTATGGAGRLKYSVAGTGYSINTNTGALTLSGNSPDYEATTTHPVMATITATDEDGDTGEMTVTVNVGNVDEAGTIGGLSNNAPVNTELTATITDPDVPGGVTGVI